MIGVSGSLMSKLSKWAAAAGTTGTVAGAMCFIASLTWLGSFAHKFSCTHIPPCPVSFIVGSGIVAVGSLLVAIVAFRCALVIARLQRMLRRECEHDAMLAEVRTFVRLEEEAAWSSVPTEAGPEAGTAASM